MKSRCHSTLYLNKKIFKSCENEAKWGILSNVNDLTPTEYRISEFCDEHIQEQYIKLDKLNPGKYIKYPLDA
jgi:hypothetical protein